MVKKRFILSLLSFFFLFFLLSDRQVAAAISRDLFPVYDSMKANVAFWQKVYAEYPTTKGLIHDNSNLAVIYEVIDLVPQDQYGSRSKNKKQVKKVKEKYKKILLSLAKGGKPKTAEEKRVYSLFGDKPTGAVFKDAAYSLRFQLCQRDRFGPGVIRSGAYLQEIKRIFKSYGLPEDLAYLPHVESSFNYKAYSKFGAAGIWQFTRSTGRRFMTVDYTLDERRDPIRATHAAARFLKENYQKLGNWPMAITAYNHGTNGMMRAKKKMGDYDAIFNGYESRSFGFASRNFYSEFIAARQVAKNYKKYFGNLVLDKPIHVHEVLMPGYAPVKDLSRYFQVDLKTMQELNPALRSPVFQGQKYVPKDYKLRLPAGNGHMKKLVSAMPDDIFVDRQKRSRFYRVQRGDTAGAIARQQGVKLQDLLLANGLDRRGIIYAGQNLRIPSEEEKVVMLAKAEKKPSATAKGAPPVIAGKTVKKETKKAVAKKEEKVKQPAVPAREQKEPSPETVASLHWSEKVAGVTDRLSSFEERREPSSEPELAQSTSRLEQESEEAAGMGKTVVQEEEKKFEEEVIDALPQAPPMEEEVTPSVVIGNLKVENVRTQNGHAMGDIRVEVGETLGHYADWLQVPTRTIRRLNGLRFGRPIKLDQKLKIEFVKASLEDFEEKRYEYHKEIEEDFFAAYEIESARLYRIQRGDNIWSLCRDEFELPFWLIRKYNTAHDFNNLKLDELLIIPVVRTKEQ